MPRKPITHIESDKVEASKILISNFHRNSFQKNPSEVLAYQKASLKYGIIHNTSKWLIKHLPRILTSQPLFLLDVGTLVPGYSHKNWLIPTYINLQVPPGGLQLAIQQCDYITFIPQKSFNIICLSLVLNFVPTPEMRGQMLKKAWSDLTIDGVLYIVLPRACLCNSKYLDAVEFDKILSHIGFKLLRSHLSPKLFYGIYQKTEILYNNFLYEPTIKNSFKSKNNFKIAFATSDHR
jgi:25S rRNA (adenine2142-N1)-methyltransferase